MSETLFIRLASYADDPVFWLIWSNSENEIIASGQLANSRELNTITNHAASRRVVVFAPGQAINFKTIPLPAKLTRQLQGAVPYMVEEELSHDVEDLFFTFGDSVETEDGHAVQVAIVERDLFESWLEQLDEAGLTTKTIIPDVLCLPEVAEHWSILGLANQWLVRKSAWEFASIESSWAAEYFSLAAQQQDALQLAAFSPIDMDLPSNVNVAQQPEELPLKLLVAGAEKCAFNMIQGAYVKKTGMSKMLRIWKKVGIAASVALVLSLSVKGVQLYQYQKQLDASINELAQVYKKAFPKGKFRNSSIRRLLKDRMKKSNASDGKQTSLLVMLSQVSEAINSNRTLKATGFRFDSKRSELRVQAVADEFQSFEKFKTDVESMGFEVKQGSLNNDEGTVMGSVTIRSRG